MRIELKERTEAHVRVYFEKTNDLEICAMLPRSVTTLEQALEDYRNSVKPGAASYGRTIYADGTYVGDIWCYCIDPGDDPQAMVSYCIFEKCFWNRGIMSTALSQFLEDIVSRFHLSAIGAFTYSSNLPSIRVLEKGGFAEMETFVEDGVESKYFQWGGTK